MRRTAKSLIYLALMFAILLITGCEEKKNNSPLFPFSSVSGTGAQDGTSDSILSDTTASESAGTESAANSVPGNEYPVVLLHGFIGWGRDELGGPLGHYYWGGYNDLQEILKNAGFDCYTAVVGPFSSNWDRACELYAQLRGVRVDYGLAHSKKHNHARFGRDYSGKALLGNWGEAGPNRKIHIIAHSQGAMTARVFSQLMEQGYADERNADYTGQEPISPLFTGGAETKNMVSSISTMAGVHNGTTLASGVVKLIPFVQELLIGVLEGIGIDSSRTIFNIYDFKLDQFGVIPREKGESIKDYFNRVNEAAKTYFSGDMKDICLWDLSPEGCMEQNAWVHAQGNTYYFSFAGISSHPSKSPLMRDNGEYYHECDANNFIAWFITGPMMGAYTCNDNRYHGFWRAHDGEFYDMDVRDRVPIDSSWWANDGVVNTKSMNGPWLYPAGYNGARDSIVDWDGATIPEKGQWNYYGALKGFDHFDITGVEIFSWDKDNHPKDVIGHIEDWYIERVGFLRSLPQ